MTVTYPVTGAVPPSTSPRAARAAAGSPSASEIAAEALLISPVIEPSSSSASSVARASPVIPRRVWVASNQPITWFARAQLLDVVGLSFQHFGEQVLGDRPVGAGELGDEPLRVGMAGQCDHGEPESCGPPLGFLVQH